MFVTLLGGILGGISRLAPEVLSYFGKKQDNKHELDMLAATFESDKQKLQFQVSAATVAADQAEFTAAVNALQDASKNQSVQTGVKFVDAINALVRPTVTYILFGMWTLVKITMLTYTISQSPDLKSFVLNLPVWWTSEDQGMLAAILNFWFMSRVFEKVLK